ncbi:hypothetical protein PMJ11TS3_69520 [Paenibacillus melissococcoides]
MRDEQHIGDAKADKNRSPCQQGNGLPMYFPFIIRLRLIDEADAEGQFLEGRNQKKDDTSRKKEGENVRKHIITSAA